MRFRPKLTALEAESRLQWLGRAGLPGIFDGRHTFSLTALPEGRTWFEQAETFTGLLTWFTRSLLKRTQHGFKQMNQALAQRCQHSAALRVGPEQFQGITERVERCHVRHDSQMSVDLTDWRVSVGP